MVMAAAQTTTLAVTLHHMLGADQSPVTGSCPPSRSQSSASGSAWLSDLGCVVTLLFVVFTDWDILSLLCTAHWEWPEKWLAAAAAPSLGPLCTGAAA